MDLLQTIAGIIGLVANIPLLVGIYKNKVQQNFVAFMLWALLDIIAAITTILQHGNYMLPLAYAFSATVVAISLGIKKQVSWSRIETVTTILVFACILVWDQAGPKVAIVASSLSIVIASIPQGVDTFKKPTSTPTGVYFLFFAANTISFIAGKGWTIEERLYPGCTMVLCGVIILLSTRKEDGKTTDSELETKTLSYTHHPKEKGQGF